MSTIINADTSDGLKFTSDTSGEIKLQSAGTDIATVNSSGITMASGKDMVSTGHVLQVVQAQIATDQSTTSTSYVTSNLSASITPSSTSSKILVMLNGGNTFNNTNGNDVLVTFYRDGSAVETGPHALIENTPGTNSFKSNWSACYLDSPSTTSSVTYTPYYKVKAGTGYFNQATARIMLTLMEIAG